MIERIQSFFEKNTFGVCEYLGEKFGMSTMSIRKFFIYSSFITFGSPVILYLILAFFIENYKLYKEKRHSIWEL
ncbi:MAG: PspC domain-containing protein [Flavobacteriales bacterium]|jgi:phage shock protein PspC (stress-responsive transcriptional regulator)|nr:PspC domain-containing protein [Flavobacteriales bacterium]